MQQGLHRPGAGCKRPFLQQYQAIPSFGTNQLRPQDGTLGSLVPKSLQKGREGGRAWERAKQEGLLLGQKQKPDRRQKATSHN